MEFIESIAKGMPPSECYTEVQKIQIGTTKEEIGGEIIEKAKQTKERYKYHGTSEEILSMACGSYLTSALINLNLDALDDPKKDEKLHKNVAEVVRIIKKIHNHSNNPWEEIKNGFFAEAAVAIALKVRNFEVYVTDFTDDTEGKIDLIVHDPKEKSIVPIQIKASTYLKDVVLEKIGYNNQDKILLHIANNWDHKMQSYDSEKIAYAEEKLDSLNNSLISGFDKMLKYLELAMKSDGYNVYPVLIAIPGGDNCDNPMYNALTGAPNYVKDPFNKASLSDIIYEKLEKIIYPEGEE